MCSHSFKGGHDETCCNVGVSGCFFLSCMFGAKGLPPDILKFWSLFLLFVAIFQRFAMK